MSHEVWPRRGRRFINALAVAVLVAGGLATVTKSPDVGAAASAPTPAPLLSRAQEDPPARSWLAAGDSYSSGEGFPTVDDDACQRSSQAWAPLAQALVADGESALRATPFEFVACTGAVTGDFEGQRGEASRSRHDLVTFSFGGNDVAFADTVTQCLGLTVEGFTAAAMRLVPGARSSWARRGGCPAEDQVLDDIDERLAGYEDFLVRVADEAVTPGGNVVVVGYPNIVEELQFWPTINREVLGTCQGIRAHDAQTLRSAAGHLNATIGQAVAEVDRRHPNGVHFTFVDINTGNPDRGVPHDDENLYEPSRGDRHALCAARPWLNGIVVGNRPDGTWRRERSFHPTADGHRAVAELVARRVRGLDWSHLVPDLANTTYPAGTCRSEEPLTVADGQSPNAGEGARPDGSDNPQAYEASADAFGDLDGDGYPDVVGTLTCTLGGATGFIDGWVWLTGTDEPWRKVPRVIDPYDDESWASPARGFSVSIEEGALVVSDYFVQFRSGDEALCCPGTAVDARWRFEDGEFSLDGTPSVTAESDNPLTAFLVGTSFGYDVSAIATPEAIGQAQELGLREAEITDASACQEGDVTYFCDYPIRRADGSALTVELVWAPPDADYAGDGEYSSSTPSMVTSVRAA